MKWVDKEIENRMYSFIDTYLNKDINIKDLRKYFKYRNKVLINEFSDLKHHFNNEQEFIIRIIDIFNVVVKDIIYYNLDQKK